MCDRGRTDPSGESGRAARLVAAPEFDEGWQIEYSVHKVSPIIAADVKSVCRNELEPELRRLGVKPEDERNFLAERLLGVPTWQPAPTWDDILKGDWKSAKLDLSVYPSQVCHPAKRFRNLFLPFFISQLLCRK